MSEFEGLQCLVVGLGASGMAAARALLEQGAEVSVTEAKGGAAIEERAGALRAAGARVETGGHTLPPVETDVAVVSPGVPPDSAIMRALRAARVPMIGEVELAWRLADCDFLAVTGTNGKTTTTALLAAMLDAAGIPSLAAGNIGVPLAEAVARVPAEGAIAVELSSFQLETIDAFRPRVSVILNVAEDHTDWHGTFAAYVRAKARIVSNQGPEDVCVANRDDATATDIARSTPARFVPFSARAEVADGAGVRRESLCWLGEPFMQRGEVPLSGQAGLEDVLAAAAAALSYGASVDAVARAVRSFKPLAHRMEVVAELDAVTYIDDSKATNPHATLGALRGLSDVVLIVGGRSKGVDLSPLRAAAPNLRGVVSIGESSDAVARLFDGVVPVAQARCMEDAVTRARDIAVPGGSVLLSPGCASLDMYESYAERGSHFARAVRALARPRGERDHSDS